MIAVVTDTCASIPLELVKSLQIELVPYYLHHGFETLRDVEEVSPDEFYSWLPGADRLPTTANPGAGDYLAAFDRVASRASHIVILTMTSKGSGAYQSACVAREMAAARSPDLTIEVIDTLQVAMVHGWAAIQAARAAQQGATWEQVLAAARHVCRTGCMLKTADTLQYLYMGGRIGRAKHLVGTLLHIKPIISMRDGVVVPVGQARSIPQALAKIVELMADNGAEDHPIRVGITHAAAPDRANELLKAVTGAYDCRETLISQLSPVLGVHTGPGCVGVNFFLETP
jgi:fatty acid kinase fatty acid binding subunit